VVIAHRSIAAMLPYIARVAESYQAPPPSPPSPPSPSPTFTALHGAEAAIYHSRFLMLDQYIYVRACVCMRTQIDPYAPLNRAAVSTLVFDSNANSGAQLLQAAALDDFTFVISSDHCLRYLRHGSVCTTRCLHPPT